MVVWLSIGGDATPSTKCGKGSGSLAQDEKLSVYPTIEVAGLTKQQLDSLLSLLMPLRCVWRTASRVSALGVRCSYTDRFVNTKIVIM